MPKVKVNRKPGVHLFKTIAPMYESGNREFYWILIAKNGKTIDRSTNMYSRKRDALNGVIVLADVLTGHKPNYYYDHTGKNGVEEVKF